MQSYGHVCVCFLGKPQTSRMSFLPDPPPGASGSGPASAPAPNPNPRGPSPRDRPWACECRKPHGAGWEPSQNAGELHRPLAGSGGQRKRPNFHKICQGLWLIPGPSGGRTFCRKAPAAEISPKSPKNAAREKKKNAETQQTLRHAETCFR